MKARCYALNVIRIATSGRSEMTTTELMFRLDIEQDWPPVAKECLICTDSAGGYRIEVPPFFIKNLSVGDVITVERDESGDVVAWSYVDQSKRSTVWIMVFGDYSVGDALTCLKSLNCNVEELKQYQYFAIDVPADCPIDSLDKCLDALNSDKTAVAYPSFRH